MGRNKGGRTAGSGIIKVNSCGKKARVENKYFLCIIFIKMNVKMKHKFLLGLLFMIFPLLGLQAEDGDGNTYKTDERLFHIARSLNHNLVCYDANLVDGKLNLEEPIKVYWLNREENPGKTNGLSYIQRKLAYGYKVVSKKEDACNCTLSAYPDRQLTIARRDSGYVCLIMIDKQEAVLQSLYVKAHPKNPLKVEYVELKGISVKTHQPVTERVKK